MQSCVCFVDIVLVLIALHTIVEVESYVWEELLSWCAEAMPRSQLGEYPNLLLAFTNTTATLALYCCAFPGFVLMT